MTALGESLTHHVTLPITNLSRFLERAAALIAYSYDTWDADAITFGLLDSQGAGFAYTFHADDQGRSMDFHFSDVPEPNDIRVTLRTTANNAIILVAFGELMRDFAIYDEYFGLLNQIDAAFSEIAPPGDDPFAVVDCTPEHLAICQEHQDTLAFFQKSNWQDLLWNDGGIVRTGYGSIAFLNDNAARFAFPAYLASALRYRDFGILQVAIDRTGTDWLTPKGKELVALTHQFREE